MVKIEIYYVDISNLMCKYVNVYILNGHNK
ncbi:hypothetical protein Catovirus_1_655 [Catovirus CTV1]|uniref:Uncharacterized protein n=1 Tax=Catovirus CTV1 TaxID=1977631 RepID=A0A1V0SA60_9VIRU|nr:hypothetical protein Catovirus_1_655 [Catovirus CTV1]